MKKIVIIGAGADSHAIAKVIAQQGHSVNIITEKPNREQEVFEFKAPSNLIENTYVPYNSYKSGKEERRERRKKERELKKKHKR